MPKATTTKKSKDHACRCGCGALVPSEISAKTEQRHRKDPPKRIADALAVERNAQRQLETPEHSQTSLRSEPLLTRPDPRPSIDSQSAADDSMDVGGAMQGSDDAADIHGTTPPRNDSMDVDSATTNPPQTNVTNHPQTIPMAESLADAHVRATLNNWTNRRATCVEVEDKGNVQSGQRRTTCVEVEDEGEPERPGRYANYDGHFDYDDGDEPYHLNFGELPDDVQQRLDELVAEFMEEIDDEDIDILRAYNLKLTNNLTDRTFKHLAQAFPKHHHASLKVTRKRVEFLAQFSPKPFDCCINSCMAYTGPYEDAISCRFCEEARFNRAGKPRKRFNYIPLGDRLAAFYHDPEMIKKMSYRADYVPGKDPIEDVFDGEIFHDLRETNVTVGGQVQDYKFFDSDTDIALGLSTDGFNPFKNRKQTCWPLLMFNYNLPPEERFKFENLICVGMIPGPKKPKDFDSFLWPLVFELLKLALGIEAYHTVRKAKFMLRAYLILASSNMPAVSMMLRIKGHNAIYPCRFCSIRGILAPGGTNYYYPHKPPKNFKLADGTRPPTFDPSDLPMRHPDTFLENGRFAESAPNPTQADQRAKSTGVSGVPLLSLLPSMICPLSFPLDFMHLIYENVGPNMIEFWCGTHKNLDHDGQDYRIELGVWKGICEATAAAGRTTPSAYGPALPDMSAEGTRLSADMKGFWFQFLGPVLLAKAFPNEKVYKHFVKLVTIITHCLQFSITRAEVHALRQDIIKWVKTYEEIYYQRDPDRLSACPVTIHSLLHIVDGILLLGPVWVYWSFAMERFCGKLGKLIRSRRFPFSHLDNQVLAHAQMVQIKNRYHLHDVLSLRPPKSDVVWEFRIPLAMYKGYALVAPRVSKPVIAPGLFRKIAAALVTRFSSNNASQREDLMTIQRAEELLGTCMIETWGRVRVLKGGDTMLASELVIQESEDRRNATFVKYHAYVDANARRSRGEVELTEKVFFGQLQRAFLLKVPATPELKIIGSTYIALAEIAQCKQVVQHPSKLSIWNYSDLGSTEIVDVTTLQSLVGRIQYKNAWSIFDRGGVSQIARPSFDYDDDSDGEHDIL